jgi:alpha-beta hydrolase superfamily lysophospholipase
MPSTPAVLIALVAAAPPIETRFVQVAPAPAAASRGPRPLDKTGAVVLLHGLKPHPFSKENVTRAAFHDWQLPDSVLVKQLAKDADVYAFAYAQNASVDEVAESADLAAAVGQLRQRGYRELALVGHSAGGVIARQFVEDHPGAGVTKVLQVCAPNGGSSWAHVKAVRANQVDFLTSLTKETRRKTLRDRSDKTIPRDVQFACIVANAVVIGDGLVQTRAQWTEDLQRQGVPAFPLSTTHWFALRGRKGAELVAELIREPLPRWDARQVAEARRRIFGTDMKSETTEYTEHTEKREKK